MFNKIGIFGKYKSDQSWEKIAHLVAYFKQKDKQVFLDQDSCKNFPVGKQGVDILPLPELLKSIDFAIVVGGDGTFLSVARNIVDSNIPILGINLGRLGFLADISPEIMCETLDNILDNNYSSEQRNLLNVTISKNNSVLFDQVAFNDVVLHKSESPRMIEFETFINGQFVSSQRADGMIIATPTGSTAYSLSAGGPILDPSLDVMSLVSINPHTMSNRPLVVGGDSTICIRPVDDCSGTATIICDGQLSFPFTSQYEVIVKHHPKFITMIHPKNHDHFKLLRAKLNWGKKL